jgi:hypothetical protein
MTMIANSVSHVISAFSCEELAESHVNKLLGWQPRTPSHRGEARRETQEAPSRHPLSTRVFYLC